MPFRMDSVQKAKALYGLRPLTPLHAMLCLAQMLILTPKRMKILETLLSA